MEFLSASMRNKATFTCPIFGVDTQMRACVMLRDKIYAGQRVEVRRGCQACITASKCPAANIVRRISFGLTNATDEVSSETVTHVKLPADVLEEILPVIVTDMSLSRHGVGPEERRLIESANDRIAKQIETAPRNRKASPKIQVSSMREQPKRRAIATPEQPKPTPTPAINIAAATGDMSAAIS